LSTHDMDQVIESPLSEDWCAPVGGQGVGVRCWIATPRLRGITN